MTTSTKIARLAAGSILTGVASLAFIGPAAAAPIPCDKPPCGILEPPRPIPANEPAGNVETTGTGIGPEVVVLAAVGGAVATSAGVATVVLLRRRSERTAHPA